jgi:hypothetical protein
LALFGLLSVADLLLTWGLLQSADGQVYEGNPVARWWLAHYGWPGLTTFKIGTALLGGGLCGIIFIYRPSMGRKILLFACATLAVVVLYSSSLAGYLKVPCKGSARDPLRLAKEKEDRLDQELSHFHAYLTLKPQVSAALIAQRLSLTEALKIIAGSDVAKNAWHLRALRMYYPGRPDMECLAANLVEYTVSTLDDYPSLAEQVARRLEAEYRACFGGPVPYKTAGNAASAKARTHN